MLDSLLSTTLSLLLAFLYFCIPVTVYLFITFTTPPHLKDISNPILLRFSLPTTPTPTLLLHKPNTPDTNTSTTSINTTTDSCLLSFNNICYSVQSKSILKGISGFIKPGTLCAIMGPSGCGKSTLLDILAHRKYSGDIRGVISMNGIPVDSHTLASFKLSSAYVMQNDILFSHLTVKEILLYSAEFRIPNTVSVDDKIRRVERVMDDLDLLAFSNTRVGVEGSGGLSRGQKRRISVAMELITGPSVLFLDEPTSGLDAYSSLKLVRTLKKLAKGGRTVICTIHQPREDIFSLFDTLLLMVGGRVAYLGQVKGLPRYFNSIGRPIPVKKNPADFIVDLTSSGDDDGDEPVVVVDPSPLSPGTDSNPLNPSTNAAIDIDPYDAMLVKAYRRSFLFKENEKELELIMTRLHPLARPKQDDTNPLLSNQRYANSFYSQLCTLLRRAHINQVRNPGFWVSWVIGIVTFLFYGMLYLKLLSGDVTRGTLDYFDGQRALFYQIIAVVTFNQFNMLTSAFQEKKMFYREHASNAYSALAYHVNWMLRVTFLSLTRAILFPLLVYFAAGLTLSTAASYFIFCLVFALVDTISGAFCIFLMALLPSLSSASSAFTAFTAFVQTSSGFFLRPRLIPPWFVWAYYGSFDKYALNALYYNEYLYEEYGVDRNVILEGVMEVDSAFTLWGNISMLVLWACVFYCGGYVASHFLMRARKVRE